MKAVLVIDVPDNILLDFSKANIEIKENAYLVNKDENEWKYTKPIRFESVPLRPLPQKGTMENVVECEYNRGFVDGRNHCIDLIMGETKWKKQY